MTATSDGVSIYVLVDALGWELVKQRPFLDNILVDRRPLQTILGYSSGAIPTVLTGRWPTDHGHWNLFYLSPETSPYRWTKSLTFLPRPLLENRLSRRIVRAMSRSLSGYRGYFPVYNFPFTRLAYFDLCERRDIYQPGGVANAASLFDVMREHGIEYECFTYHSYSDQGTIRAVTERLASSTARVYFLYLCELDAYLHFHVSDPDGVSAELRRYEDSLRAIYRAARSRWGHARLFVFSDHGMTPVRWTYDLAGDVDRLGLKVPGELLMAYDSTMARFWAWSDRAERLLVDLLSHHSCGRLVKDRELHDLGINFPDGRYGHHVFLLHPGGIICPSDMGRVRFAGMHGYHPSEPTADAVLLSSEQVARRASHITDIYGLLLDDLGVASGSTRH